MGEPHPMVVLLTGDAEPLVQQKADDVIDRWAPLAEPASFNRSVYRAGEEGAVSALADARTPPMGARLRLVWVRQLDQAPDAFFSELEAYLDHPSPDTLLVLTGRGFPPVRKGGKQWSSRITKRVKAAGGSVEKLEAKKTPSRPFVMDQARRRGRTLTPTAASLLVELAGDDLGLLCREIDKLDLAAAEGATIDEATVAEVVASHTAQEAFTIIEYVIQRRPDLAFPEVCRLLDTGASIDRFMGALLWKARQVVEAGRLVRQGHGAETLKTQIGMPPSAARSLHSALQRHGAPAGMVPKIADAWLAMRRDRAPAARRLEALVLDLARP